MIHTAFIGVGSNLGDRLASIRAAFDRLTAQEKISYVSCSPIYETKPVGMAGPVGEAGSRKFFNAVFRITTTFDPLPLLREMQLVETELGRGPNRSGPRTIDLDLLLFDDIILRTPGLTLPHPRMHERGFVLVPFADIAPDLRHPIAAKTISELRDILGVPTQDVVRMPFAIPQEQDALSAN